jgi:hypothetical protein
MPDVVFDTEQDEKEATFELISHLTRCFMEGFVCQYGVMLATPDDYLPVPVNISAAFWLSITSYHFHQQETAHNTNDYLRQGLLFSSTICGAAGAAGATAIEYWRRNLLL